MDTFGALAIGWSAGKGALAASLAFALASKFSHGDRRVFGAGLALSVLGLIWSFLLLLVGHGFDGYCETRELSKDTLRRSCTLSQWRLETLWPPFRQAPPDVELVDPIFLIATETPFIEIVACILVYGLFIRHADPRNQLLRG